MTSRARRKPGLISIAGAALGCTPAAGFAAVGLEAARLFVLTAAFSPNAGLIAIRDAPEPPILSRGRWGHIDFLRRTYRRISARWAALSS
jgi:hypothetical protein